MKKNCSWTRRLKKINSIGAVCLVSVAILLILQFEASRRHTYHKTQNRTMHLAVSVCGDRLEEFLVMVKSVTLFTLTPFHVHVFISDKLRDPAQDKLLRLQRNTTTKMNFTLYQTQFPKQLNVKIWRSLFRPCASQRLFIPEILHEIDSLIYVDTDVIFLRSLGDIWKNFFKFNKTQIAALVPEAELPPSWYTHFQDTPSVPPLGVNSGVFLMNATRMRQPFWVPNMTDILAKYRGAIRLGDQDILNIYFHKYPEQLYQLTCDWNYRSDHFQISNNCKAAKNNGIGVIHGNRMAFHNERIPVFKQLYQSFLNHKFGEEIGKHFNNSVTKILAKASNATEFVFNQLLWSLSKISK